MVYSIMEYYTIVISNWIILLQKDPKINNQSWYDTKADEGKH